MKNKLSMLLVLLLILSGCSKVPNKTVSFYYPSAQSTFVSTNNVILPEQRTDISINDDICNILQKYLQGPQALSFRTPFPYNTSLIEVQSIGSNLLIVLSDEFAALSGVELIIACAGITKTCLTLHDAVSVTIQTETNQLLNGQKKITMTADSILLLDNSAVQE